MRQEYTLGEFLKSRYMRKFKLLNSTYIYKEVSKPKGFFLCNIVRRRKSDWWIFSPMYSKGIREILVFRIRKPATFLLWNSGETCALKSGIQLKESEIPLTM